MRDDILCCFFIGRVGSVGMGFGLPRITPVVLVKRLAILRISLPAWLHYTLGLTGVQSVRQQFSAPFLFAQSSYKLERSSMTSLASPLR